MKASGKVCILRGIPGSGKSTLARRLRSEHSGVILSADDYFTGADGSYHFDPRRLGEAHGECFRRFLDWLEHAPHDHIVVDNTNIAAWECAPYVLGAEAHGRDVRVITLRCAAEVAAARNVHGVPEYIVRQMAHRLQTESLPAFWKQEEAVP